MTSSVRHLPHIHAPGHPLFVTFRLHDSLPAGRAFPKNSITSGKAFVHMDRLLESQRGGPVYLGLPDVAGVVAAEICRGAEVDYILHAWVIMPNHVHLLFTPKREVPDVMQRLKGRTAREANKLMRRTGTKFWQEESYDRLVRDAVEFKKIEKYIVENPVKAGLASSAEEFRWSSGWGGLKPAAG
jgi:REP element-mobilizing transposase RayT